MSNPYVSPPPSAASQAVDGSHYSASVQQVRIVAILMMIHGVLCLGVAAVLIVLAVFVPQMMEQAQQQNPRQPPIPDFLLMIYYVMGIPAMISGILQIVGGIYLVQFKRRMFGIVAAIACLASASTVYCGMTAIALTVYALVILLNESVRHAFEMRSRGTEPQAILAHLSYR